MRDTLLICTNTDNAAQHQTNLTPTHPPSRSTETRHTDRKQQPHTHTDSDPRKKSARETSDAYTRVAPSKKEKERFT